MRVWGRRRTHTGGDRKRRNFVAAFAVWLHGVVGGVKSEQVD